MIDNTAESRQYRRKINVFCLYYDADIKDTISSIIQSFNLNNLNFTVGKFDGLAKFEIEDLSGNLSDYDQIIAFDGFPYNQGNYADTIKALNGKLRNNKKANFRVILLKGIVKYGSTDISTEEDAIRSAREEYERRGVIVSAMDIKNAFKEVLGSFCSVGLTKSTIMDIKEDLKKSEEYWKSDSFKWDMEYMESLFNLMAVKNNIKPEDDKPEDEIVRICREEFFESEMFRPAMPVFHYVHSVPHFYEILAFRIKRCLARKTTDAQKRNMGPELKQVLIASVSKLMNYFHNIRFIQI